MKSIIILLLHSIIITIQGGIFRQRGESSHVDADMLDICLHHVFSGFETPNLVVHAALKPIHSLRHGEILGMSLWLRCSQWTSPIAVFSHMWNLWMIPPPYGIFGCGSSSLGDQTTLAWQHKAVIKDGYHNPLGGERADMIMFLKINCPMSINFLVTIAYKRIARSLVTSLKYLTRSNFMATKWYHTL